MALISLLISRLYNSMMTNNYPKIILHVDDDADDLFLIDYALKSIDSFIVLHQEQNGKKALDFLRQTKLSGNLPSLIILDMNMPAMNAHEIYKEVKKDPALSEIPIIIFTTSIDYREEDYWKNEEVRMITKPASFDELKECIKKILAYYSILQSL